MKILIVMSGFFPGKKYGGPPVSVDNFCSLMKEYECYIVTLNHDMGELDKYPGLTTGWNDRVNCKVLYLSDAEYIRNSFENVIKTLQPDIIYLQGLFQSCILPCLQLAKQYKLPVLLAPRGELCAGALSIKKYKKIPYIEAIKLMGLVKNIHWQSTSDEETEAIKRWMKANDDHIHYLSNIPSLPKGEYPKRGKVAGEGRFVFLSRIHPKKNLLSAIKYFHEVQGKAVLDIYGPIEDEEYWKECQEEIRTLPSAVTVEYKGLVEHDKVHEVFSQYNAFLFPTLSENYGHVIAESLIIGTPVIISDQTPWRGLEAAGAGWDFSLSDDTDFAKAINKIVVLNESENECFRRNALAYITRELNIGELKRLYLLAIDAISRG